jgi:hypothetical protein
MQSAEYRVQNERLTSTTPSAILHSAFIILHFPPFPP